MAQEMGVFLLSITFRLLVNNFVTFSTVFNIDNYITWTLYLNSKTTFFM